jgi:RNA polymerase sigma factor FliA
MLGRTKSFANTFLSSIRSDWMSRSCRSKARMVSDAIASFEQAHGGAATEEEIAEELGLSSAEYASLLDEVKPVCFVNLDAPLDSGDADLMHDLIADEHAVTADMATEKRELVALVAQRIQQMPEMMKKVICMYYFEEMRLAEIAVVFGVSESRICQINAHAILSLRKFLESKVNN